MALILKWYISEHEVLTSSYKMKSVKNFNDDLGHWFSDYLDFADQKKILFED